MKIRLLLMIALLVINITSVVSMPPAGNDDIYFRELEQMYKQEQQYPLKLISENKCWYLKYTMKSVIKESGFKTVTHGELLATNYMRYMKTEDVEVVMDKTQVFTIDKKSNLVMRTGVGKGEFEKMNKPFFDLFNDSAYKTIHVVSVTHVQESGVTLKKFDVVPYDLSKSTFTTLSYYFDENTRMLRKVHMAFSKTAATDIDDAVIDIEYNGEKKLDASWQNIRSRIFDNKGHFKPQYANYQYRDLLKK